HFDAAFQFAHRTIHQVWIVLFAAVINLGLNVIAIPHWQINGAAVASLIAFVVSIVLTAVLGRRHFVLPFPVRASIHVLVAGAAMGAAVYPFRNDVGPLAVAGQICLGAFVYGAVLIGGFDFLELREHAIAKCRSRRSRAGGFE